MNRQDDGSTYWSIVEELYKGAHSSSVLIRCTSESDNNCNSCEYYHDCNRLRESGMRTLHIH